MRSIYEDLKFLSVFLSKKKRVGLVCLTQKRKDHNRDTPVLLTGKAFENDGNNIASKHILSHLINYVYHMAGSLVESKEGVITNARKRSGLVQQKHHFLYNYSKLKPL